MTQSRAKNRASILSTASHEASWVIFQATDTEKTFRESQMAFRVRTKLMEGGKKSI